MIGRYEILGELGRGAMGVVFKGRDPFIGRLVAVKTITTGIADNPDLLDRFRREAQAAGNLQHPNIVTIYEMSDFEGTPFIAMEYLEGDSLEKAISQQLRLPLVHKLGFLVQTCRALDYAHRHGVIHRDIKPANIMVTSEGVVKVVDFGIARIADAAKTQTGILLGTLYYMSPEQVRGQHADQKSDVWAFGAVMYELLAYRRPFDGENHAAVLMSILQQEPPSIREFAPECPAALESIVQRALRKEPAQRYPSMESVLVDLEPMWTTLQKDAVQKLVTHGRDLMQAGKLEEASEVLRKSLSLDTGNTTAKALFAQVSAQLAGSLTNFRPLEGTAAKRSPLPAAALRAENAREEQRPGGTMVLTEPADSSVTGGIGTGGKNRDSADQVTKVLRPQTQSPRAAASEADPSLAQNRGGATAETVFAPQPTQPTRNAQAPPPSVRAQSAPAKSASLRPASAQPLTAGTGRAAGAPANVARRKLSPALVTVAVVVLLAVGAAGYWKWSSRPDTAPMKSAENPPASAPAVAAPAPPAGPPATSVATPAAAPAASSVSLEDQQRQLIDRAHEAADAKDYKTAQMRLDEAAKLNGPLNPLIKDLRREFSDEAHGAELRQAAQKEQTLWTRAMTDMDAGSMDEAETSLREILTLPEAGRHWADAARYVDEVIPQRRQQQQLWSRETLESNANGPEHRMNEMKILDQVLIQGGAHQQDARERRDMLMAQFGRANRQKIFPPQNASSLAQAPDFSQISPFKDAVDQAVTQGDAKALEQLQELRPKFKAIVDGGGPLVADARDYLNNIIPRAQKYIEDRLAKAEADAAANAKYREAVKQFDQAVATENTKSLRSQIQPKFQEIADSGGPRTEEAHKYVSELIPAALKKSVR